MTNIINCRYCAREVQWATSKAGKRYLAEPATIHGEDGRRIKEILPAHRCAATPEQRQAVDAAAAVRAAEAQARGEFAVGTRVRVVKLAARGGTPTDLGEAVVVWVGPDKFHEGRLRYGVLLEDGQKAWVGQKDLRRADGSDQ